MDEIMDIVLNNVEDFAKKNMPDKVKKVNETAL